MTLLPIDRLFALVLLLASGPPLATFGAELPSPTPTTQAASPSQAEVRQLFQQLAEALAQKDRNPDQIMRFYAPDCSFEITITNTGQSVRLDRQQYYQALEISLQQHKAHSYQQAIAKIQISGQRAIVQATVTESITYASGLAVQGISQQVIVLEERNSKLLITQVAANTCLEPEK
jgi:hypothetical protein